MFGTKPKFNGWNIINDVEENQVTNAKKELSELSEEGKERWKFLTAQIASYEAELEKVQNSHS